MSDPFRLVADFNAEVLGIEAPQEAKRLSPHRKGRRLNHLCEEIVEYHDAVTLEDEVDALVDLIYVAMGDLYERGVDGLQHFLEVHNCNMNRVRGENANRPPEPGEEWDGFDAVKPDGWKGPEHGRIIAGTVRHVEAVEGEAVDPVFKGPCPIPPPTDNGQPKVILIGHGRHGKDTVAEMLRTRWGMRFCSSSLFCAERVMMPAFAEFGLRYSDAEACFNDRHGSSPVGDHREFWYKKISEYNHPDKARLARELLAENDIYVGVRDRRELWATRLVFPDALVVWVDASNRLEPEGAGSINVEPWMADVVLDNNGDLEQLQLGVDRLGAGL
jgi:hypothetical protein